MKVIQLAAARVLRRLPRAPITRFAGRLADSNWPRPVERFILGAYCKFYGIELGEFEDVERYESFDAFFTRRLKPGRRPIDDTGKFLVSPADGMIAASEEIGRDSSFMVKGKPYRVAELIGDESEAERYVNGLGCVIYLSPKDYHRVHSPVTGRMVQIRSMAGDYFPVNDFGVRHVPDLFVRNRRVALQIDAEAYGWGVVTMVMVSAMIVGRITLATMKDDDVPAGVHRVDIPLNLGDELGMFHLGSTVVLFVESGKNKFVTECGLVKFGSALIEQKCLEINGPEDFLSASSGVGDQNE